MTAPEFSRPIALDRIGEKVTTHRIEADAAERAALAERFGLISLARLSAEAAVSRQGEAARARGRVEGEAEQACVVTGEPLAVRIEEPFDIRLIRETPGREGEEIELGESDCETMFYQGRAIDLGEAAAESFALALDPFPRGPNADAALLKAGVVGEAEARPLGAFRGLRDRLENEASEPE